MNKRGIILMVLLNIAAIATGLVLLQRHLDQRAVASQPRKEITLAAKRRAASSAARTPSVPPMPPSIVYRTNAFRWRQLESPDYRTYIANLRAIGCPEATIRDIILTDVMRLYAAKRGQLYHNGREFKYWETDEKRKLKLSQIEEREKILAQIDKELPAVLRELLGINYERELNKYFVDTNEDERRLAFLSETKRSQVLALREQIETARERLQQTAPAGSLGYIEKKKEIEKQRQETLAKILTPDELAIFDLTASETAEHLRGELVGFNPTESEFREIFQRQKAIDDQYAFADLTDENISAARNAEQEKIDAEIKTLLGRDRATEYETAKNTDYRDLVLLSERYELPASTSQTLLDIRQLAELEKRRLQSDKQISDEARFRAMQAVQNETQRTVRETLGERAFTEYSQSSGTWIRELGPK